MGLDSLSLQAGPVVVINILTDSPTEEYRGKFFNETSLQHIFMARLHIGAQFRQREQEISQQYLGHIHNDAYQAYQVYPGQLYKIAGQHSLSYILHLSYSATLKEVLFIYLGLWDLRDFFNFFFQLLQDKLNVWLNSLRLSILMQLRRKGNERKELNQSMMINCLQRCVNIGSHMESFLATGNIVSKSSLGLMQVKFCRILLRSFGVTYQKCAFFF